MQVEISSSVSASSMTSTAEDAGHSRKPANTDKVRYGLPCANCRIYYQAEIDVCPVCGCGDRVSPVAVLVRSPSLL
jgi:rRNA maturation endonuclease Nob1